MTPSRRSQQGGLSSTEILPVDPARFAQGGTIKVEPTGTPIPIRDHASLLMGSATTRPPTTCTRASGGRRWMRSSRTSAAPNPPSCSRC